MEPLSDRPWFVVKIVVLTLLVVVLILAGVDGLAIFRAKSHLGSVATNAAMAAAGAYSTGHDATAACAAASASVKAAEPGIVLTDHFCKVDTTAGTVQVKLHDDAGTLVAGHLPYVRRLTVINARGTANLGAQ